MLDRYYDLPPNVFNTVTYRENGSIKAPPLINQEKHFTVCAYVCWCCTLVLTEIRVYFCIIIMSSSSSSRKREATTTTLDEDIFSSMVKVPRTTKVFTPPPPEEPEEVDEDDDCWRVDDQSQVYHPQNNIEDVHHEDTLPLHNENTTAVDFNIIGQHQQQRKKKQTTHHSYIPMEEETFPTLVQVQTPKLLAFTNLPTDVAYMIVKYEKKTETYEGKKNENIHLHLVPSTVRDFKKPIIVRATQTLKNSLDKEHDFFKLFKSHMYFVASKGKRTSQAGKEYIDFDVDSRVRCKVAPIFTVQQ